MNNKTSPKFTRTTMVIMLFTFMMITSVAGLASATKGGSPNLGNSGAKELPQKGQRHDGAVVGQSGQICDGDTSGKSDTGKGANGDEYYDHNCTTDSSGDPTESSNGNGSGDAVGRPCEGCVGAADDKNPGQNNGKGQMPNETDLNRGYECDSNNGIGKGNPAHTGCSSTPPPPCVVNCDPPPPCVVNCDPPPPCVVNCDPEPPEITTAVLGVKFVQGAVAAETLPRTGGEVIPMILVGLAFLGIGSSVAANRLTLRGLNS